jgi:hypothetical protein
VEGTILIIPTSGVEEAKAVYQLLLKALSGVDSLEELTLEEALPEARYSEDGKIKKINIHHSKFDRAVEVIAGNFTQKGEVADIYNSGDPKFLDNYHSLDGGVFVKKAGNPVNIFKVAVELGEEICFIGDVSSEGNRQYAQNDFYIIEERGKYRLAQADYVESNYRSATGAVIEDWSEVPSISASSLKSPGAAEVSPENKTPAGLEVSSQSAQAARPLVREYL